MKGIALVLLGVALLAIAGLVALQHFYAPAGFTLEVAKALLNVLTVAVIAQAVAFLIALHNETRRKQSEADQLRHRTLDALNEAFIAAKRTRRSARAGSKLLSSSGTAESRSITRMLYFKSLEQLNDVQLRLEVLAKDIETNAQLFREGQNTFALVSSMEEYLNELIDEWEHLNVQFGGRPASVSVEALPCFNDLIGYYKSSRFRPQFVHSYYGAIERIRGSLVTTRSETWKHRVKLPPKKP